MKPHHPARPSKGRKPETTGQFCPVTCGCGKFVPGIGWLCVAAIKPSRAGALPSTTNERPKP